MKAWHFLQDSGRMRWRCGRIWKPKVGQTLRVDPDKLVFCDYGLHASARLIDALQYAQGALICRVELGGKIITGRDKVVASERTIIAMADATHVLHSFACWTARNALALVQAPDPRSVAAIAAKEAWLRGEITDDDLADASADALAAASAAASAAARAWARDAARAAARAAWASAAASAAAWAAARDAARDAARAAARAAQNDELTARVCALLGDKQ